MSARHHWLVGLYPPAWRERYGDELSELIESEGAGLRATFDVIRAAGLAHIFNPSCLGGSKMTYRGNVIAMTKHPSAYVPLILSGCALALLLAYLGLNIASGTPVVRQADEGIAAHLYQLMIGVQALIIPWFMVRWAWRDPSASVAVLAAQVLAIGVTFIPLWYYGL